MAAHLVVLVFAVVGAVLVVLIIVQEIVAVVEAVVVIAINNAYYIRTYKGLARRFVKRHNVHCHKGLSACMQILLFGRQKLK